MMMMIIIIIPAQLVWWLYHIMVLFLAEARDFSISKTSKPDLD